MSSLRFDPHEDFIKFLAKFTLLSLTEKQSYTDASKKLHKRVLGLLIVEHQFQNQQGSPFTELDKITLKYLAEFRSDLLSSFFIIHIGLYKASMMSARSGLENFFRTIAGYQGIDFRSFKSVFELIDALKAATAYSKFELFTDLQRKLIEDYANLCNFTHSTSDDFLSLERKLEDFPKWDSDIGNATIETLLKIAQRTSLILLIMNPAALHTLHHKQKDLVLDSLPAKSKLQLREIIN